MSALLSPPAPCDSPTSSDLDELTRNAAALLDEAARVIENYGWCQYDMWVNAEIGKPWLGTGVCAVGGLMIAHGQTQSTEAVPVPVIRAVSAAEAYLRTQNPLYGTLASYNDVVASRSGQVIDVLRGTAQALRDRALRLPDIWEEL